MGLCPQRVEVAPLDSMLIKVHPDASGVRKVHGPQAIGKSRGGGAACASAPEDGGVAGCVGGDRGRICSSVGSWTCAIWIAVQPGSHAYLFDWIGAGAAGEWFTDNSEEGQACDRQLAAGVGHATQRHPPVHGTRDGFTSAEDAAQGSQNAGQTRTWTWVTADLPLTRHRD